jgi:hypothetical protein
MAMVDWDGLKAAAAAAPTMSQQDEARGRREGVEGRIEAEDARTGIGPVPFCHAPNSETDRV